jgi:polyisoprenyl-phosphate glycosyltransferase
MESITFSVVIPVYRNEETIPQLLTNLELLARRLPGTLEVVFVIDGSPDRSLERLRERLGQACFDSQVLLLSRNFGAFSAIAAGLQRARGQYLAVIAADLQEPADLPLRFFQTLLMGNCDVVVGQRLGRCDPLLSRMASAIYWRLYRRYVQPEVPAGGVDVFACNRAVRNTLVRLNESNTSLVGLLIWLGFRREIIGYQRLPRPHGKSGWGWQKKLRYLKDSIFAFSDLPIRLLGIIGAVGMLLSLVLSLVIVICRTTGKINLPGYSGVMVTILFFGALQSLSLSVIGEYLWRCFENTKRRPRYIVFQSHGYQPSAAGTGAEDSPQSRRDAA